MHNLKATHTLQGDIFRTHEPPFQIIHSPRGQIAGRVLDMTKHPFRIHDSEGVTG